jgi:hypothetical protein
MKNKKYQSKHWDKYTNIAEDIYKNKKMISGFPFDEGFPKRYSGQRYELILSTGERCEAFIDYVIKPFTGKLEWKLTTDTDNHSAGKNVGDHVVLAWKEK